MERNVLSRAAEYINQQREKKRWTNVVSVLAAVVVFCTTYALILPAITLETDVFCGREEHTHGADCYGQVLTCTLPEGEAHVHTDACYQTERTLVCTLKESQGHTHTADCQRTETLLTCTSTEEGHVHGEGCYTTTTTYVCGLEESSGHTHTDACWQETRILVCTQNTEVPQGGHVHNEDCYGPSREPTCGREEHQHDDACYADKTADLESAAYWEKTFADVTLTGDYPADVLAIAETQLGYTESSINYITNDEGRKLGYSRYGAWYGDPYGDWCAMFVSFCLHYGGVPAEALPREASCQRWIEDLAGLDLYREAESYIPTPGDLIFFNWDKEPDADHVGLVEEVVLDEKGNCKEIKTIEGNSSNKVQRVTYDWGDPSIMGYGELPRQEVSLPEETTQTEEVLVLSPEEQIKVNEVIAMIDALPDAAVAEETLLDYESFEDWEGYEAYFRKVGQDGLLAYTAYEELTEEGKAQVTNYSRLQDLEWIWSVATLEETAITLEPGTYGSYIFSYNETRDAFLRDPAYGDYYNENSPLGTAGSFHLVAFGTANLGTHTNGNVLAHTLRAGSNFGTNNYPFELSYAVNYEELNSGSASGTTDHILVVGSGNAVTLGGNRDNVYINGSKIDRPYQIVQDKDSDATPFINLDRVEQEMLGISAQLAVFENVNVNYSFTDQNQRWIELTDPDGVGVYNMTAAELNQYQSNPLRLKGFKSGHSGTIVINVDCSGASTVTMPQSATIFVDGQEQGTNEVVEFSSGKVVWNFRYANGCTIEAHRMTGMVLALGATVNINQNLNGTVVAENINVKAESHRTDFTGSIIPKADVEGTYIQLIKVDMENISTRLPNAKFALYKWDDSSYVLVTNTLVTSADGRLEVGKLSYNTAYRLVETTAPNGYVLKTEPYDFLVSHSDTNTYPVSRPSDFSGETVSNGHIKYFHNEKQEEGNYILPETGGMGDQWYLFGGFLLMAGAVLWYRKQREEKGGTWTS